LRIARFALAGGFVRFYTEREFRLVAEQSGVSLDRLSMIDLGRDWVAVLRIGGQ
jgi:hypothetical protein